MHGSVSNDVASSIFDQCSVGLQKESGPDTQFLFIMKSSTFALFEAQSAGLLLVWACLHCSTSEPFRIAKTHYRSMETWFLSEGY